MLGVSIGNCIKTDCSASLNKLTVLNSITVSTLYLDDYFGIADKTDNQKFAFGGGINYYRSASHQFNNQANNVTYLDLDDARVLVPGNLTVSGVVQSPLTNLIGSSCANYQSKNDLTISYNTLNGNGIGGYNSFDPNVCPLVLSKNNRPFYFNRRTSADAQYNCLDFMSWNSNNPYTHVATFGYNTNYMGLGTTQPSAMFHATGSCDYWNESYCEWCSSIASYKFPRG